MLDLCETRVSYANQYEKSATLSYENKDQRVFTLIFKHVPAFVLFIIKSAFYEKNISATDFLYSSIKL